MIGKPLGARHALAKLDPARALAALQVVLAAQAAHLIAVRAKGPSMVACLVVNSDAYAVKLCRALGMDLKRGRTVVFGLEGDDASRWLEQLPKPDRAWLEAPCAERETKVLLVAGGLALISLETRDGKTTARVAG